MTDLKAEFRDRIGKVHAGMLGLKDAGHLVPMSPRAHGDHPDDVWFVTSADTHLAQAVEAGDHAARLVVSDDSAGLYADLEGNLAVSRDGAALEDVWSVETGAWVEDGKQDPDVRLLKFTPSRGQISVVPRNTPLGGAKKLYELVRANVTDARADIGAHGSVAF